MPLEQVRVWLTQDWPAGTLDACQAVTDAPLAMFWPLNVHNAGVELPMVNVASVWVVLNSAPVFGSLIVASMRYDPLAVPLGITNCVVTMGAAADEEKLTFVTVVLPMIPELLRKYKWTIT